MPSPLPGMDPWLEETVLFRDLHHTLISLLREAINALLPREYAALSSVRVWVEASERRVEPDVDVIRTNGQGSATSGGGIAVAELPGSSLLTVHAPAVEETIEEP
jgi:hypothetical protein